MVKKNFFELCPNESHVTFTALYAFDISINEFSLDSHGLHWIKLSVLHEVILNF